MRDYIDIQDFINVQLEQDYNNDMDNNASDTFMREVDILPCGYYNYNKQ